MRHDRVAPSRQAPKGNRVKNLICLFAMLALFGAEAQVVKCKDANGRIIYSDVACPTNTSSATVNLSGGNITEHQIRAAQERRADNVRKTAAGAQCPMLTNQAQQTFSSFLELTNSNRWGVSFQALQTLANSCSSSETCQLVKDRVEHAQQRYSQDNTATRGGQLNSVTSLYAQRCLSGGPQDESVSSEAADAQSKPGRTYWTKDQFGNAVRSDKCSADRMTRFIASLSTRVGMWET